MKIVTYTITVFPRLSAWSQMSAGAKNLRLISAGTHIRGNTVCTIVLYFQQTREYFDYHHCNDFIQ